MVRELLSICSAFQRRYFLSHPMCWSHSAGSGFLSDGIVPCVSVCWRSLLFVFIGKVEFRASCIAILVTWKYNINSDEKNRQGEAIKLRK